MSSAVSPGIGGTAVDSSVALTLGQQAGKLWWLWLVTGIAWVVAALVILQFDSASVKTIGVIVGCMFLAFGAQQLLLAVVAERLRWLWAIVGVVFLICGVICFALPQNTFAALADMLGFLFLAVGVWWMVEAFVQQRENPLWWLSVLTGVLMCILAFWTSGQFFFQKAYTLLVVAGIWALMHGITDIIRAFKLRSLFDRGITRRS